MSLLNPSQAQAQNQRKALLLKGSGVCLRVVAYCDSDVQRERVGLYSPLLNVRVSRGRQQSFAKLATEEFILIPLKWGNNNMKEH